MVLRRSSALLAILVAVAALAGPTAGWAGPPATLAPGTWTVQTDLSFTQPNSQLTSVSCTGSGSYCLASGTHRGLADEGYAEVFDGTGWSWAPAPPLGSRAGDRLAQRVHCVADDFCVRGRARWDGSSWSEFPGHPDPRLVAIECVSRTWCLGLGYQRSTPGSWFVTGVWDGRAWTITESGDDGDWDTHWTDIDCESPTFCLAVREVAGLAGLFPSVMRWDGLAWSLVTGWSGTLADLECASPTSCFVSGTTIPPDSTGAGTPFLQRWNGSSMSAVAMPPSLTRVTALSCARATECVASGSGPVAPARARWRGGTWSALPGGRSPAALDALSCVDSGCVGVGRVIVDGRSVTSFSEVYDGYSWEGVPTLNPAAARLRSLSSVSCLRTYRDVCAVLGEATDLVGPAAFFSPDFFYPDTGGLRTPARLRLADLGCAPPGGCVAAGLVHTRRGDRPAVWTRSHGLVRVPLPKNAGSGALSAVSCVSPSSCVAVGRWAGKVGTAKVRRPLIVRYDGTRWRLGSRPVSRGVRGARLTGVSCPGGGGCTVVGVGTVEGRLRGLVSRWRNGALRLVPAAVPPGASTSSLTAVDCTSAGACVAVGGYRRGTLKPYLLVRRPSGWSRAAPAGVGRLTAVDCPAAGVCRAVGSGPSGLLAVSGGPGAWLADTVAQAPTAPSWDVSCVDPHTCVAVGGADPGVVLTGAFG